MRSLVDKIAIRKIAIRTAVGLYLGEHDVVVSKVAATPFGLPVVVGSSSERCTPEDLPGVIERLLIPLVGPKRRVPVAVGLAGSRLFFGTRITPTSRESTPEAELQNTFCSANLSADDLVVDLRRGRINKFPVARMVACRKNYMGHVVAALSRLGVRPVRTEPAPCALVRLAERQHPSPRRSKTVLRVFLGGTQGLAVVVVGGLPVAWKVFALPGGSEGLEILSAARGLETQRGHYGIESALDYAMIHGRADLHERLQQERFPSDMSTRVTWHEGPAMEGAAIACGLALGCLATDGNAFDLSRSTKSRALIKEIFPWGELAFAIVLMGCMAVVLGAHSVRLDEVYATTRAENTQHSCLAAAEPGRLASNKKALEEKVEAVRTFLDSRILWTTYTRDIAARMPANARLTTFTGKNALAGGGKTKAGGGSFRLEGMAPLLPDGSMPPEIAPFLGAIPNHPLWKRDFTSVVTEIALPLSGKKELPEVDFTITCLRKARDAANSSQGSAGGTHGEKKAQ